MIIIVIMIMIIIIIVMMMRIINMITSRCVLPAQLQGSEAPSDTLPSMLTRIRRWVSQITFR